MIYIKRKSRDRKTKEPVTRYQFRSYNAANQRYEPVPVETLPDYIKKCSSDEEAEKYCRAKSSEENAIKSRLQKRLEWADRFQNFPKLIEDFGKEHAIDAPNTWRADVYHLEAHVLPFFLGKQIASNVHEWPLHFQEFKKWLRELKPLKLSESYAYNTQNKIIKSLNLFLRFYSEANPTGQVPAKCSVYNRDMCKQSSAKDVIEEKEFQLVWAELKLIRPVSADLFYILVKTGLRIKEALGLCVAFLNEGEIAGTKGQSYHKLLTQYGLTYFGYICLESQPALHSIRDENGHVPRKSLKSRKRVSPESFRFIPVFDKEAWKILTRLANEKLEELEKEKWGQDPKDYIFFDGITSAMFYADLKKAFKMANLRFRSSHKSGRHTFSTWFYDVTSNDQTLARLVLGHKDKQIMENYSHLAEQIGREQQQKETTKKKFTIIE